LGVKQLLEPHLPILLYSFLVAAVAGYIRGYSGFGFGMIAITALSLLSAPAKIVPAVLLLDICASALLFYKIRRQIDWQSLKWLLAGVAAGTPVGVWVLGNVPAEPMIIGIALVIMALVLLLLRGFRMERMPGKPGSIGLGIASGILDGGAAIGGPPAILFYFSSPAGEAVSRASIIAFILGTDTLAALSVTAMGMMKVESVTLAASLLFPMCAGLFLGSRAFTRTPVDLFRKRVLVVLLFLAALTSVKALWQMITAPA
jgi:uncharacterized protein